MIGNLAAAVVLTAIAVECILRLPFIPLVKTVIDVNRKALRVFRAKRVSDHWKEKVMLAYSGETLKASLKLAGLIAAVGAALVAISLGLDIMTGGFTAFIVGLPGLAFSLVVAAVYVKARTLVVARSVRL